MTDIKYTKSRLSYGKSGWIALPVKLHDEILARLAAYQENEARLLANIDDMKRTLVQYEETKRRYADALRRARRSVRKARERTKAGNSPKRSKSARSGR